MFQSCCAGQGTCVPEGLVEAELAPRLAQDSCAADLLCAPTALATDPNAALVACRADGDLEGRCAPSCLPDVARQADRLSQGTCESGQLCLPCFDPRNGEATGACTFGGDRPHEPAKRYASCCEGRGTCVPSASIPTDDRVRLAADSCEQALCVPSAWLKDERPLPEHCRALGDLEGRCLPTCLYEIAKRADQLIQGSCTAGSLCSPCYDPRTGEATGACETQGDRPREPAKQFARCCGGSGRCVPEQSVPAADRERLATADCRGRTELCAPSEWLDDPRPAPQTCRAVGDLEGRCFSSCLPDVSARAKQLTQSSCADHQLCLPCFDPLTGEDTQACRLPGDPGPVDAPRRFDVCCGEIGRCLPRSAVDSAAQASLGRDSCRSGLDALCVPNAWIEGQAPGRCSTAGDLEGRCLPSCLPQVAAQGDKVQRADCPAQYACLPCFDPLSGQATGACQLPGDTGPSEPPRVFERCCSTASGPLGTCLPNALLPRGQTAPTPPQPLCAAGYTCVPDALLRTPEVGLRACTSGTLTTSRGACVPECLLGDAASLLARSTCGEAQRCAPCSQLGLETPAC